MVAIHPNRRWKINIRSSWNIEIGSIFGRHGHRRRPQTTRQQACRLAVGGEISIGKYDLVLTLAGIGAKFAPWLVGKDRIVLLACYPLLALMRRQG